MHPPGKMGWEGGDRLAEIKTHGFRALVGGILSMHPP